MKVFYDVFLVQQYYAKRIKIKYIYFSICGNTMIKNDIYHR